jgi:membrane fusion protein, multidrug efflux system
MNPIVFAMRRPVTTLLLVVALVSGVVVVVMMMMMTGLSQTRRDIVPPHKIVATSPKAMDVIITRQYVCQIHSQRHIDVRAAEKGYLEEISVKEGQAVKKGDSMFKIVPASYEARLDAEKADAKPAQAKAKLVKTELNLTKVRAPFDGIVDRLQEQFGSLVKEGDILTTLSDNSVMWVYFNVPESQYLEYIATRQQLQEDPKVELVLANGKRFPQRGKIGAIAAQFNNETGNIPFRADFDNPDGLLRHGQTGTILIHRTLKDAIVIPQRAVFELLDKRYVWVLDKDDVAHRSLITIKHELEDIFVINSGLKVSDRIVLEGVRLIEEDAKVEFEFRKPEEALSNQKFHAE